VHLPITSRDNQWFRRFREAAAAHRDEIVLEGPKQIRDAIAAGWLPIAVAVEEQSEQAAGVSATEVTFAHSLFRALSDTVHSQGVLALFHRPSSRLLDLFSGAGLVVALDAVQDPGNVGTICRLAAAFGAAGVALTEGCADPFAPKAIRASAGAILRIGVVRTTRRELIAAASERRVPIFAAASSGDSDRPVPVSPAVLVLGSEGEGVSQEILDHSEQIAIATAGTIESLNVGSAAAILLARWFEQRRG
jgi:RNA methyltransferase, TrmH family